MSLLQFTSEAEAILRDGPIQYARIVDVYLDTGTRHYWELYHPITIDDGDGEVTYTPVGGRIVPPSEYSQDQSLDGSTHDIQFDSSRAADNSDFVGELVDADIVQRRVRVRSVLFRPHTNMTEPVWIFNQQDGIVDEISDSLAVGAESIITLRLSSGTFSYLERRAQTYTPAVQKILHPNDTSLTLIAPLVDVELPWGQ